MNRREFTRMSALSLAAAPFATRSAFGQAGTGKVGFAVIGLGVIAQAFMEQVATSQTTEVVAFVTGHPSKGREWAQKYNIPNAKIYSYDTMHEMQANSAIQAVYVATPNGLHMRDTVASAKAGKHVLCEKPMANTPEECRTMIAACKDANVKLMIAYRMQYEPLFLKAKDMLAAGALGKISTIEGSFGFPIQPNVWRVNKKLAGGGPLVDVGIYPLNAIRFLTGEEPSGFTAMAATTDTVSGRFKEIEESMVWTMKFPSGALASCSTSYGASLPGFLKIHGEKGMLDFQNAYGNGGVHLVGNGRARMDESSPSIATQLRFEAEHLADCMRNNTTPRSPGEEGLRDHLIFQQLYKAAGIPA